MGYGADAVYTRMAMQSMPVWQDLFARTGQSLFVKTGVLWMARQSDPYSRATLRVFREAGVRHEIVHDLGARYPQMRMPDENVFGILEPDSGALMARRAVVAVVEDAVRLGVVLARDPAPAEITVYTCGAWLPKVFPDLLGERIHATRQEVYFFGTPPADDRFAPPQLPIWIDFIDPREPYGFPDLEGRGVKIAFHRHGPPIDPDRDDRAPSVEGVAEARSFLAERFPALRDAPLTEARVCQYENTSSGDFLIDRDPDRENVWIVGGGSGHGFKHGPAVGEYVCDQVLGRGTPEPRFSLAAKSVTAERRVL
jgi:sarcosine oxidase